MRSTKIQSGCPSGKVVKKMRFKSIFQKIVIPMALIVSLMGAAILGTVGMLFKGVYEQRLYKEIDDTAVSVSQSVSSFMDMAYRLTEQLNHLDAILSMDTETQTPVLEGTIERNDYFELIYIQDMNGDQTGRSSGTLGNRANRWWFIQMLETMQPFVSKSYYSVATNMACASIFFPMRRDGQDIGVLAADIKLDKLQEAVSEFTDLEEGKITFIIDGEGVVVAHPEEVYYEELYNYRNMTRTVTKKDAAGAVLYDGEGNIVTEELPIEVSSEYAACIQSVLAGQSGNGQINDGGRRYYISYAPIPMDGASDSWAVITLREKSVALGDMTRILLLGVLIAGLAIVLAILLILRLAKSITRPIRSSLRRLTELSQGDLTSRLPAVTERDETGQLLSVLGETIQTLDQVVRDITTQLGRLADGDLSEHGRSYEYAGDFRQLGQSLETISHSLNRSMRQVNEHSDQVLKNAVSLAEISQSLARDSSAQARAVEDLNEAVGVTSQETSDSAAATERARERMGALHRDIEDGNRSIQELLQTMEHIYMESEKICDIAKTIEDIAQQTNILALNASVEAARAGAAGTGFSVIAQEVRNLSTHCAEAVQNTTQLTNATLVEIRQGVDHLRGVAGAIRRSTEGIREVDELVGGILETAKAQAASLDQSAATLERVSQVVKNSSAVAQQSAAASEELQRLAHQLQQEVARYRY